MKKKIWDLYAPFYKKAMQADQKIYDFIQSVSVKGKLFSKDETKQAGDASDRLPEYYPGLFMRFSRMLLPAGLPQKSCRFRFH